MARSCKPKSCPADPKRQRTPCFSAARMGDPDSMLFLMPAEFVTQG